MERILSPAELDHLIALLGEEGYDVRGPVLEQGVVQLRPVAGLEDLPHGIADAQAPGRYRTSTSAGEEYFEFAVGPASLKADLFPPRRPVWRSEMTEGQISFRTAEEATRPLAFIGVRPCDMAAVTVQDQVLLNGDHVDPDYAARRRDMLVVVVNCTHPSEVCFCASMGTGPRAVGEFDIALTEVRTPTRHFFVADIGTEAGAGLLDRLAVAEARSDDVALADQAIRRAEASMTRTLDTSDLPAFLSGNATHPRWAAIAERCLACTNCTTRVSDLLLCQHRAHHRPRGRLGCRIGAGIRASPSISRSWAASRSGAASRLATANGSPTSCRPGYDQFGTFGCVGCGRCITWCPVGIDLTEEIHEMRETSRA